MNYRHAFHAGNFADVFKHLILVRLLKVLARKDKRYAYIETHAGAGRYDLHARMRPGPENAGTGSGVSGASRCRTAPRSIWRRCAP